MKKTITAFLCLLLITVNVYADYTQTCNVKYQLTPGTWSDYIKVDVKFMTGSEVNTKFYTSGYNSSDKCACIVWADNKVTENKVTIIKLTTTGLGELNHDTINYRSYPLEGDDQDGKAWIICPAKNCF